MTTLLLAAKTPLLSAIKSALKKRESYQAQQQAKGDELIAGLWISLAQALGNLCFRRCGVVVGQWENMPDIEPETLRALAEDLIEDESGHSGIGIFLTGALRTAK